MIRRLRRARHRWWERRWLVPIQAELIRTGDRVLRVTSPPVVAIEEVHDIRASANSVMAATPRRAHRLRRTRRIRGLGRIALYRVDEPPDGRSASGHWVAADGGGLVLTAIALVPFSGMRVEP